MAGKKSISILLLALILMAGLLTGTIAGVLLAVSSDLPQVSALEDFEPSAATRILSADGRVLGEFFVQKRIPLALDEIPLGMQQAIIAVEDRRFYSHPGLDVVRNVGALISDIRAGRLAEGASTITQQLARNLFLTQRKTLQRKIKEIFLALQIERRHTKQEILRLYLNQIPFGDGAYGVAAAAEIYFAKNVRELTLAEAALLAGLPQSPARYSPFRHPDRALARRRTVLQAMVREQYITPAQAEQAAAEPLRPAKRKTAPASAPYFVEYVRNFLMDLLGENAVYKGGLRVTTTLTLDAQRAAEQAIAAGLTALRPESAADLPTYMDAEPVQAALVALDVHTGRILAWVGGEDYKPSDFDRVNEAMHQTGILFAPFIYAAALENGFTQADRVWDSRINLRLAGQDQVWRPDSAEGGYEGEMTLRRALELGKAAPLVKLIGRIGLDKVVRTTRSLGISAPLAADLSLASGNSRTNLLELSAAYNVFANAGLWVEPHAVTEITDRSGQVIYRASPARRPALSPETAYIMTDMLSAAMKSDPVSADISHDRALAGMAGNTPGNPNALIVGYAPELTVGVWVGFDSGRRLDHDEPLLHAARPIWRQFMNDVQAKGTEQAFGRPVNVVVATMDAQTGRAVPPETPGAVAAAFRLGTEPKNQGPAVNPSAPK